MQRDTAIAIVLALLALLAIGAAGATLENPVTSDSQSGVGADDGGWLNLGSGAGNDSTSSSQEENSGAGGSAWLGEIRGACLEWLSTLPVKLSLAALVLAVSGYVWWRTQSLGFGLVTLVFYGPLVWLFWAALSSCGSVQEAMLSPAAVNQSGMLPTGGGRLGSTAETATSQPSILLGIVLAVLAAAAVSVLYLASGDDDRVDEAEPEPPEPDPEPDVAALGRVAGEAADRMEGTDAFDNEVYRAWAEMTEHLAVDRPDSSTPAEFAAAAVDAGMAPEDVRELTDLFEAVRYGDRAVTEERERRAREALRRIESTYAEAEE